MSLLIYGIVLLFAFIIQAVLGVMMAIAGFMGYSLLIIWNFFVGAFGLGWFLIVAAVVIVAVVIFALYKDKKSA